MSSALIIVTQDQVANPTKIAELKQEFAQYDVHQQLLERIVENAVQLPHNKYSRIHLSGGSLSDEVADRLYLALQENGQISGVEAPENKSALIIAGFTMENGQWTKKLHAATTAAPLRRTNAASGTKKSVLPIFKRASTSEPVTPPEPLTPTGNDEDEDDIINEDDLIDDPISSATFKVPEKCDPGPGKKRRRACKDCTCGLKELEEEEVANRDNLVQLNTDDLAEIDFTVPGKAVGGCGSCALGDAFRCDGCPYLGLPPFKPGEVVSIDQFGDDL